MAFDAFLKIDGIDGESTAKKHEGEIEVLSFSWNISNTSTGSTGGGGGAGKAVPSDFNIVKHIDKASPALIVAVCSGEHIRDATFTVEQPRAGKAGEAFLKIKLTDVLISSYQTGGGGNDLPTDQVSLNFAKINIQVRDDKGQWVEEDSCDFKKGTSS
jgi:type VI secretion system secreted protein Hcp